MTDAPAQGRIMGREPVAVVDIGSNSVRLVLYEGNVRALTMLFNEKILSGLGKGIAQTNRLDEKSVASAIAALKRFRKLIDQSGVTEVHPLATAAAREATNGPEFVAAAEEAIGTPIRILSGQDEAFYAAQGVVAGFHAPNGVAGDLGGGSLELVDIASGKIGRGLTLPLGGLRLQDLSGNDIGKARGIADTLVASCGMTGRAEGRAFFAVGGTWRNLAKLHMEQRKYPLHVMHGYSMPAGEWTGFLDAVAKGDPDKLPGIAAVSKPRRALLAFGAVALQAVIKHLRPATVVLSSLGVREGYLHTLLAEEEREKDPLLEAAEEFNVLRSRSPAHARELVEFSRRSFETLRIDETPEEERLRAAACLLSDVGWRAHPDYRGAQSLSMLTHASLSAVDHAGRAYLGLANYYRHEGDFEQTVIPEVHALAGAALMEKAKHIAALFRVAYILTASTPGILNRLRWRQDPRGGFTLVLPRDLAGLVSEKPLARLESFARVVDRKLRLDVG
ncbi:Ppx/GppA family phosphatase [Aureimonas leprariae]|uniref:Ppx/GppA family phosphatase n=1 Tax=Plantimonas leprariae TaxID=2615207 RepID=A0A7V7PQN4_9HYPH|nr:Ppx/GppA phosphatase family protein [Aureimonas leprariae]KAB0680695.1 Ppx/GppA family phosphatase [Aureimonas leprariae]